MNFKVNDYDKFAEKRHFEVTNGMKKSLRFVEKPMMLSMLPNIEGKRVFLLGCGTAEERTGSASPCGGLHQDYLQQSRPLKPHCAGCV